MFEIKREATVGPSWMNYELRVDSGLKNAFFASFDIPLSVLVRRIYGSGSGKSSLSAGFSETSMGWQGRRMVSIFEICKYSFWCFKKVSLFDQAEGW